jgi:hypothetical protein
MGTDVNIRMVVSIITTHTGSKAQCRNEPTIDPVDVPSDGLWVHAELEVELDHHRRRRRRLSTPPPIITSEPPVTSHENKGQLDLVIEIPSAIHNI